MSVCPKCGAEIEKNANFCENCGTAIPQSDDHLQKNASVMGDKNVVAGDVVAQKIDGDNVQNKIDGDVLCDENVLQGDQKNLRKDSATSPMIGDKNVVAGDVIGQKIAGDNVQNKIMGNVIYNVVQDETKRMVPCAICGRRMTGDMGHTCPRCGNTVCSDCYDESQHCCEKCASKAYGEIVVDKSGYGDVRTITEALQSAKDNGIIRVRFGHYDENLIINKPLTIVGEPNKKGEKPVICGFYEEGSDVISIEARATLKNLFITQAPIEKKSFFGEYEALVAIYNDAIVENCEISKAEYYGVTLSDESDSIIKNCMICENNRGGILVKDSAKGVVENCDISSNKGDGIKIEEKASLSIKNSKIHDQKCFLDSGIAVDGYASIEHCEIYDNEAWGIKIATDTLGHSIKNCRIFRNMTGMSIDSGSDDFRNYFLSRTEIDNCEIYENTCEGISLSGCHPYINECQIYKNQNDGIRIRDSHGHYESCNIFENGGDGISIGIEGIQDDEGEWVEYETNPTIENCKIYDGKKSGIAIKDGAEGTISNCEIYNNEGPGIHVAEEGSELTIEKCKIHNGKNNGILIEDKANAIIEDCDISNNVGQNVQRNGSPVNVSSKTNSVNPPEVKKQNTSLAPKPVQNNKPVTAKAPSNVNEKKNPTTTKGNLETPKDPRCQTNIDWSKDTPTTIEEWNKLSPEQKQDWANWHRNQSQIIFATIAILIEIILSIIAIVYNEQGAGITALIAIGTLAGIICTGIFRNVLYRVLRTLVAGGLSGSLVALLASIFLDEGPLRTVSIVLSYVIFLAVFWKIESKGGMDRTIPNFPQKK